MLFEACGDGTEVLQLIEETLNEVAEAVEERAEHWNVHPACLRLDVSPAAPPGHLLAQSITVVGAVCEQDLAFADHAQHTGSAGAVMGLTFCQPQQDREAIGIDKGVDLCGQAAPRAPHAACVSITPSAGIRFFRSPFLTLAAC
jgi:hypothetical protein